MGSWVSKHRKSDDRVNSHSSNPEASQLRGAVYTTVDEPDFVRPYRDPLSVKEDVDFPLDGQVLDSISDKELVELFNSAPRLHEFSDNKIVRISKSVVLKGGPKVAASQARDMIFAAESLRLPVPKTPSSEMEDGHFIVMDYIAGPTVEESWPSLEQHARESVSQQVADMIETMQSHRLSNMPPGPIGSPDEKCQGPWFTDYGAGPFKTLQDLEDWFNHKVDVCIRVKQIPATASRFRFRDLAFTHQDIAERNLGLGAEGKVWLVDWGCAGVYPVGFEQAALREQSTSDDGFVEMVLSKLSDRRDEMARQKARIAYGLSTGRYL